MVEDYVEDNQIDNLDIVEELIKNNEFNKAQSLLDNIYDKGAQWHCMQAALYYKQGWLIESNRQIESFKLIVSNKRKYGEFHQKYLDIIYDGSPEANEATDESNMRSYIKTDTKVQNNNYSESFAGCCCECLCEGMGSI